MTCTSDKGLDYAKLVAEKKLTAVSDSVKAKLVDKWVSRGIYFAEQGGLTELLQDPSSFYVFLAKSPQAQGLHLGHTITFDMARKI